MINHKFVAENEAIDSASPWDGAAQPSRRELLQQAGCCMLALGLPDFTPMHRTVNIILVDGWILSEDDFHPRIGWIDIKFLRK